ncbi:hypothetical protein [Sphingobacterium sp. JUb56]|uniref:hypothetical protein n=1 Tax=Sphingobacterium sp. JUb56 TaxID=2587145 RepID=UPI001621E9F5|nr:hypothetical protein [Sphingobacterium sp. JUb56]MBB2953820.1 hypothetical protein [Sphingobacterium sp. JUb56]
MFKIKTCLLSAIFLIFTFSSCSNKDSISEIENRDLLTNEHVFLQERANVYPGKSVDFILNDLVDNKIISNNAKSQILKNINSSEEEFKKEAIERINNRNSLDKNNEINISLKSKSITNPHDPILSDDRAIAIYDNMVLMLSARGISWGCIGAIAGAGLSIAGGIIGGPATVAAAAIWGIGHILSVVSLQACAKHEAVIQLDRDIRTLTEGEFIEKLTGDVLPPFTL